jgi:hypothetical protein
MEECKERLNTETKPDHKKKETTARTIPFPKKS